MTMADFNFNLKPPDSIPGQAAYGAYGVYALWRRVNGISTSGGGGGTPSLTSTYIGYGNSSNQLTGSSDFYYDPTKEFIVGFSGKRVIKASSDTIILGDVDSAGHSTTLSISDASQSITVGTGAKNVVTTLSNITGIRTRTEPDKDGTYAMTSDLVGTITTPAYGTTVDLSAVTMVAGEIRDIEFSSSTGATSVLLPTGTKAAIGAIVIVGDLLAISNTSNITVDAGTSNTLNSNVIAQTKVMNQAGNCWTFKKVSATQWKLQ